MTGTRRGDQPNILIIMTDQQKATASHLYGNTFCQTPGMARLADSGVLYENAFTPHPLCVPARISFWTGRYPHAHGGRRNETLMPRGAVHAPGIWNQAGYHVGLIGKNHCFTHAEDLAQFDTWCDISHGGLPANEEPRGMPWFRPRAGVDRAHAMRREMKPQNEKFAYAVTDFPAEDYSTGLVVGQTVRFLEQHRNEPFALWVSIPDPHEPWVAPRQYVDRVPPESIDLPPWRPDEFAPGNAPERNRILHRILGIDHLPDADVRGLMSVYYGMVQAIDDGIIEILDALENLGLREDTIVVFCSDHGDFMGEHMMQCKGGAFYDCLTRVPLIVSWPGMVPQGAVSDSMVNLVDVVPTLLRLQGVEQPRSMQGSPLPVATDGPGQNVTFSEYGAGGPPFTMADLEAVPGPHGRRTLIQSLQWREAEGRRKMARTQRWKYVHDPMGDMDELYDLQADPWELQNLSGDANLADVKHEMRLHLADWSILTEDGTPVPLP
ncbi:MAG: sulfatase-like hydrolase/transferase [Litorilinea sp.]